MPHLPVAVSERLGWRTHLPPMQVYRSVAKWCAQITAKRATIFSDRPTDAAQILRSTSLKAAVNKNLNCRAKVYHNNGVASKRGYERYEALAKASPLSGASVETENYYQHAAHYLRLMIEQAVRGCVRDGEGLRSRMEFQSAIPESTFKAAFVA